MTPPRKSSGVTTSTFMIGSSSFTAPLLGQFAERRARRDIERQRVGIHFVVFAVRQRRLEVDHREAGQQAAFLLRLQALFDGRE